ncbi:hypothetical protein M0Q97_07825 [Candidatus Dojkabacteria bacterium]|jgi:hypothetical protein|nr:hypothetical protein [Candidatus Dojkabacteria bacterium]
MKTFDGDFDKFLNKIKNNENFSLSRWGDGELMILEEKFIDIRTKGSGEFRYDPKLSQYEMMRKKIVNSYIYKDTNYYIGVACPCCVGREKYEYMKKKSNQNEENLTWANIFVNSNYKKSINILLPELKNHVVNLVVNKNSKFNNLPFKYKNIWCVGTDAWCDDYYLVDIIMEYIKTNNIKNELFLFAAGPLANILTHELWEYGSKDNIYIDIGSILDPYLNLKLTRGYQLGAQTLNKVCIW